MLLQSLKEAVEMFHGFSGHIPVIFRIDLFDVQKNKICIFQNLIVTACAAAGSINTGMDAFFFAESESFCQELRLHERFAAGYP